ncbi:5-carboxymethyl-2-hydroxymuconate Delta-isomerase [Paenibacillus dendritiformis]|uniref:5-carboxymethyl-2-hydroxymuconate isomerase n=1 Tax=Paenibacillus dendritiformis C454 TaxID=1131935 RepID=H3SME1_9BACL|nr:5-carboxymethyl-2-hydroxymuconate Delta-isomerase [Paenibacillus dendritiformis]EHQ59771.1 5-carboxymethyl-2-hydroxymuconate isomerase [Paenibacillus dendritiformis C454]PZM62510.1 5-carboxymethyl-2-hydroxymuconate isomerase [Paenibacillus dendritiformis]WGU94466.1 5-carboxymethyl-2-hydroxymuconate Delta-isomerase [Paenibacillus dendritiformis]CAH8772606.1 5-carboxymethyl-2-hydroxymuconate Delta-isomerase [Paenibacillus dendritiformis]
MPHIIVEYTSNIKEEANIPSLLQTIHHVLLARRDSFPIGGIRSRAIELHDYLVADGAEDDAFVHITLKIGSGRSEQVKRNTCDALFDAVKTHFAPLFDQRYLALSLELAEFSEGGTYKHNNIHARYAT